MKLNRAGFTLIEMTLVLAIAGIIIVAGDTLLKNYTIQSRVAQTQYRMTAIDNALQQYLKDNGTYPCPSSLSVSPDIAGFGMTNPNCALSTAGTFQLTGTGSGGPVRIGAVPVRSLNLADEYETDAWQNRFYYAVVENLATTNVAFDPTNGSISVIDSNNLPVAAAGTVEYVLISAGQDKVGAYTAYGVTGIPCSPTTLEGLNCSLGPSANFRKTSLTSNVGNKTYDDYVIFRQTPAQGIVPSGTIMIYPSAVCATGWTNIGQSPTGLTTLTGSYYYCKKN